MTIDCQSVARVTSIVVRGTSVETDSESIMHKPTWQQCRHIARQCCHGSRHAISRSYASENSRSLLLQHCIRAVESSFLHGRLRTEYWDADITSLLRPLSATKLWATFKHLSGHGMNKDMLTRGWLLQVSQTIPNNFALLLCSFLHKFGVIAQNQQAPTLSLFIFIDKLRLFSSISISCSDAVKHNNSPSLKSFRTLDWTSQSFSCLIFVIPITSYVYDMSFVLWKSQPMWLLLSPSHARLCRACDCSAE